MFKRIILDENRDVEHEIVNELAHLLTAYGIGPWLSYTRTMIVLARPDGTLLERNPAFEVFEKSAGAAHGLRELLSAASLPHFEHALQAAFSDNQPRREMLELQAGSEHRPCDCLVVPLPDGNFIFLAETPEAERVGRVFKLSRERGGEPIGAGKVGAMIAKIGKKAGVVGNKADGKFASAHDLRRAFGTRWAKRVMPAVLRRLMRHSSITTTMGYYVYLDAAEVADELWAGWGVNGGKTPAAGNTLGNTAQETATPTNGAGVTTSYQNAR